MFFATGTRFHLEEPDFQTGGAVCLWKNSLAERDEIRTPLAHPFQSAARTGRRNRLLENLERLHHQHVHATILVHSVALLPLQTLMVKMFCFAGLEWRPTREPIFLRVLPESYTHDIPRIERNRGFS